MPEWSAPPASAAAPAPHKRRAVLITTIVLSVVLVLCGGGATAAFFLVKQAGGSGTSSPATAVDGFLTAVLRDHDVQRANKYVCADARDPLALSKKINELKAYEQRYKSPQYSWPPPAVESQKKTTATVTVSVKITTSDDRVAEKRLRFVTVKDTGWWVCEINEAG